MPFFDVGGEISNVLQSQWRAGGWSKGGSHLCHVREIVPLVRGGVSGKVVFPRTIRVPHLKNDQVLWGAAGPIANCQWLVLHSGNPRKQTETETETETYTHRHTHTHTHRHRHRHTDTDTHTQDDRGAESRGELGNGKW